MLKFNGENGRKPQTEARRYVYRIVATMIANDMMNPDGWLRAVDTDSGHLEEPDWRRLRKAALAVRKEMERKGGI